ncbi:MAG: STAS domain-containing protein [Alphaproteobacteria bacterium]|nr:STAS domain-containing protein [Alphaproteobacteria bacterium]
MAEATVPCRVSLGATMDAASLRELRDSLQSTRGLPIEIDASAVTRPSTLGLQLLMSAALTWRGDGLAFHLCDPSPPLVAAAQVLGATSHLPFSEPVIS